MRAFHAVENGPVLATLALLGLTSAAFVVGGFQNGDFDQGLSGWRAQSARQVTGIGVAQAELGIGTFDDADPLASLRVYASAGTLDMRAGPDNAALTLARLRQDVADIPGTGLSFEWIPWLTGTVFAQGVVTYEARLIVERATPPLVQEFDLLERSTFRVDGPCGGGAVFDGRPTPRTFHADLRAAGFAPGDDIRVTVEIQAQAGAASSCDFASFQGGLLVDRFALREALVVRKGRQLAASRP